MITSIGQVMLYVEDIEKCAKFWKEQAQFERVEKQEQGNQIYYIVAPKLTSDVQFVLHDKKIVAQMNPELNLGTPSILMVSSDLQQTYDLFVEKGIHVNPIMDVGFMKVFNFSDCEGNYFAIRQE
ncbi:MULTISPECIES: VOC family protein [unclassified Granulicatella]|uniref:VOC family protein n=1 Tax=unclassified Granulicatella TaxID=2630493 RepID=UPI0010735299|nr:MULTISPECIES: VOC family protein [unclassified Granulicatella]MBF0780438.1 VOC family protein [Granulicatella sp. 19428wC4_WM01]TFU95427.1 VOC family protein [Granulicatella sp. WM01]